ncbi:MAG: Spy/CpxP family protein refolding chaperone [Alphaproteobacteria bacterium]|nr:Spy/CpxP family protein refolding chaperone [Alphaproteobacteria bacterium]
MTFASTATRGATRQHLLWVALALSLVLNLCFIAGALWARIQGPPAPFNIEERLQRIGSELDLNPQQRQNFDRYSGTVRADLQQMRDAVEPLMSAAWSEIAKPDADEATVMHFFDQAAQTRRGFQHEMITTTLSFLATLSPDQRAKFVQLFHQRPRSWGQPPPRAASPER